VDKLISNYLIVNMFLGDFGVTDEKQGSNMGVQNEPYLNDITCYFRINCLYKQVRYAIYY
jgi:hypothetical protein